MVISKNKILKFAKTNRAGMALVIGVFLFLVTVAINPKSLNLNSFGSIMASTALLSYATVGQTMVIIVGDRDLSVGAQMSMAAIVTTTIMKGSDERAFLSLGLVLLIGASIGFISGICTVKSGLPGFIVTLAVSFVVTRLQYVFTRGMPEGSVGPVFKSLVQSRYFGFLPSVFLFGIIIIPAAIFLIHKSRFGKQLYLVGNNPYAARLNGINSDWIKILAFTLGGCFAGVAGMLGAGQIGATTCQMFDVYAYNSLIAVIVGGVAAGSGSYLGSIAGAFVMTVLSNGLTVLDISSPIRNIILGSVLILLLGLYNRSKPVRQ